MKITFQEFRKNKVALRIRNEKESKLFKEWLLKNNYIYKSSIKNKIKITENRDFPCHSGYSITYDRNVAKELEDDYDVYEEQDGYYSIMDRSGN